MGGIYRRQALRSCQHGSPCLVSRSRFHSASPVCVRAGKAAYSSAPASSRTQTRFAGLCVRMRTRNTVRRQPSGLTPREPPPKATSRPYQRSEAPRVACSRELRSPQSKARPTKCLARAGLLISPGSGCSVMTSRNIGYQYRPRAKAGRVTPRGPLTPGANTSFMCSFLFCVFFLFPPAVINHGAPCLRARPTRENGLPRPV